MKINFLSCFFLPLALLAGINCQHDYARSENRKQESPLSTTPFLVTALPLVPIFWYYSLVTHHLPTSSKIHFALDECTKTPDGLPCVSGDDCCSGSCKSLGPSGYMCQAKASNPRAVLTQKQCNLYPDGFPCFEAANCCSRSCQTMGWLGYICVPFSPKRI